MGDHYAEHLRAQIAPVEQSGRWTPARKSAVVELIRRGDLTMEAACARYGLSAEELSGWQRRALAHGQRGLSVTKLQAVGR